MGEELTYSDTTAHESRLHFETQKIKPTTIFRFCTLKVCFLSGIILILAFEMSRNFLTVQEAVYFFWTLDDNDVSDLLNIDNELVIPTDSDALCDTEEIDDLFTRKIEETMCNEVLLKEIAGVMEVLVSNRNILLQIFYCLFYFYSRKTN